ncbi:MAG: alpha/beta fold hydrolase [Alphaproteobacteria bacterium]|nr:alpha/beta fold hydrolase [Alphaproteobacteria bacterium]MBV9692511.1 alpha/beta fold hydrolase [Alphaproteobacteria bacterium]
MALSSLTGPRLPPARGAATHLVVLCHGYGADGNDLIGLAPYWQRVLPTAAFVAPNAPEPCAGAPSGYQWFPISRLEPLAMRRGVEAAAATLSDFIDAELKRLALQADRLALVGFSQGTMMALHVGLSRPAKPACIVGFSGLLAGDPAAALGMDAPPVLLVHGADDPMIPAAALFDAAGRLAAAGSPVRWHVSTGLGHSIDEAGILLAAQHLQAGLRGQLRRGAAKISCPVAEMSQRIA